METISRALVAVSIPIFDVYRAILLCVALECLLTASSYPLIADVPYNSALPLEDESVLAITIPQLSPGMHVNGYELVENAGFLGVCHYDDAPTSYVDSTQSLVAIDPETHFSLQRFDTYDLEDLTCPNDFVDRAESNSYNLALIPKVQPTIEHQCLLQASAASESDHVPPNYSLHSKFAAGAHGELWRAVHKELGFQIVLKRLFPTLSSKVEMGLREAYFGHLLQNHSLHIARFIEYFTYPSTSDMDSREIWLAFKDEGSSLREYLYTAPSMPSAGTNQPMMYEPSSFWHSLRSSEAGEVVLKDILRQVLESLCVLHKHNVTHRDLKPSNLLVHVEASDSSDRPRRPPIVKLADFGSAIDSYTLQHLYTNGPSEKEETVEYQPPEVLFSSVQQPFYPFRPESYDLWSMGVLMLELLFGSPSVFQPVAEHKRRKTGQHSANTVHDVITQEFCLQGLYYTPPSSQKEALVAMSCSFADFHASVKRRDPYHRGFWDEWGVDLIYRLLQWDPMHRISAKQALQHAFFQGAFVCPTTGRRFATKSEMETHQRYLQIQRQRGSGRVDESGEEIGEAFLQVDMHLVEVDNITCPHCGRKFSTVDGCERHLSSRRHAHSFCSFHYAQDLEEAIDAQTSHVSLKTAADMSIYQNQKKYMEDYVSTEYIQGPKDNFMLYVIADGHMGSLVAEYVVQHASDVLLAELADADYEVALYRTFYHLQQQVTHALLASKDEQEQFAGSTLTLVLHLEDQDRFLAANVGDSTAIVMTYDDGKDMEWLQLTQDHWPQFERERIEKNGGFVALKGRWRVQGQLAVSRSLGDLYLRQFLTSEPFVRDVKLEGGKSWMLVAASDGLWEAMEPNIVAAYAKEKVQAGQRMRAKDLVMQSCVRGSRDNVVVVVDYGG